MLRRELMERELRRLHTRGEQLERQLIILDQLATEPPDGSVIRFTKRFQSGGRPYSYAAIRCLGEWYTTGPRSPKAYPWEQLVEWMLSDGGVTEVQIGADWDTLDGFEGVRLGRWA